MTVLSSTVSAFLVTPPSRDSLSISVPVEYATANPGQLQFDRSDTVLDLPDRVLEVSRHGVQVGSQHLFVEPDGMRIYPRQWEKDVHWTCIEFKSDERPARHLYVETWRLSEVVGWSLRLVPRGWEKDFAGVADDVELDAWLRSLAGTA